MGNPAPQKYPLGESRERQVFIYVYYIDQGSLFPSGNMENEGKLAFVKKPQQKTKEVWLCQVSETNGEALFLPSPRTASVCLGIPSSKVAEGRAARIIFLRRRNRQT